MAKIFHPLLALIAGSHCRAVFSSAVFFQDCDGSTEEGHEPAITAATKPSAGLAQPPADRFLSPVKLNERSHAPIGPRPNQAGDRCRAKGFLSIS